MVRLHVAREDSPDPHLIYPDHWDALPAPRGSCHINACTYSVTTTSPKSLQLMLVAASRAVRTCSGALCQRIRTRSILDDWVRISGDAPADMHPDGVESVIMRHQHTAKMAEK
jgi:hypothetical protein